MLDEKRFPASFAKLDRDKDGEISKHEWMLAIDLALEIRLKDLRTSGRGPRPRARRRTPRSGKSSRNWLAKCSSSLTRMGVTR